MSQHVLNNDVLWGPAPRPLDPPRPPGGAPSAMFLSAAAPALVPGTPAGCYTGVGHVFNTRVRGRRTCVESEVDGAVCVGSVDPMWWVERDRETERLT